MKQIIYCFSGTGNSLRAARIIAEQIGGAKIVHVKRNTESKLAEDATVVGFVCPVYEWDMPEPMKQFVENLVINVNAYVFMIATYILIPGRCFETLEKILREKGTRLHYGKALRCVASQCIAYEPFPSPRFMVPRSDRKAKRIGKRIGARNCNRYPRMSFLTRSLYNRMMMPFLNVQHEYDRGFYVSDKCKGCGLCQRICPCDDITIADGRPVWNRNCIGCNACVVYCPSKAIMFKTPDAYEKLDNAVTRRLGLPDNRTRYHNPYVSAKDLIANEEEIFN